MNRVKYRLICRFSIDIGVFISKRFVDVIKRFLIKVFRTSGTPVDVLRN